MEDGSFIKEYTKDDVLFLGLHFSGGVAACFDFKNNLIWTYTPQACKITTWLNLGLTPAYEFPTSSDSSGDVVMTDIQTKPSATPTTGTNTNVNITAPSERISEFLPPIQKYSPEYILSRDHLLLKSKDKVILRCSHSFVRCYMHMCIVFT
jgi:hypothetical protein